MLKIALCFGTRPQVIKASVLLKALRSRWAVTAIDTGQHYDYELNGLLYQQLEIPEPDHFLEVGSGEPAEQTAEVLSRTTRVLQRHPHDAVIVIGDTNSTLGCALAARKGNFPLVHVEAGLRSSEPNLPEELNRRVVDVMATLLCAPSPGSAAQLRAERVPGTIAITGDVARDVLIRHLAIAPRTNRSSPFALATIHRAAITSDRDALRSVIQALGELGMPVLFALHPRTRIALERFNLLAAIPAAVSILPPLGYLEAIAAVRDATVVLTDSGGLQREAYWLGTPCVTLRSETEWGETVECGANRLVAPLDVGKELRGAVQEQCRKKREHPWTTDAYGDGHAAERVTEAIATSLLTMSVLPSDYSSTPARR